jgi:hypothetical protein
MSDLEVTPLDEAVSLYKVCLEENGVRACTLVSSMHLVEDKRKQLQLSILNASKQALYGL